MKTNLDSLYKTDKDLEKNGIWFQVSDETAFLIRRFGGSNTDRVKKAMAKHYKPYSRIIEKGAMEPEKEKELTAMAFVEACMIDWRGVEIDGVDTKFSFDAAVKFFLALPDLLDELFNYAQSVDNYREELGN